MQQKFLNILSLTLLQIVIVGNLQVLPTTAAYGAALPMLYLCAVIGFFLPCILMVAELATTHPQTGGAYIWCEQAFGAKIGFITVSILWIANLLWYPSIFLLIAANFAYLFDISLAQNKTFIISFGILLFWLFTGLNCIGVKFSSRTSIIFSIIGVIIPLLLVIVGGCFWLLSGKPSAVPLDKPAFLVDVAHFKNVGFLIAIVISLFGIELTAVHAGNVKNPRRSYPLSLLISSITVLVLLILSALAIGIIIPVENLNPITGLLDALIQVLHNMYLPMLIFPILMLVFLGNIGSIAAWMLGSTRGMYVACQNNHVAPFLQKVNRHEAPVGVLLFEAIIFTIFGSVFLFFPRVTDSFWLMLDLASQVTLIYYIILFCSAIRLRYKPALTKGFIIPGGNLVMWIVMGAGILTSFVALCTGFIPPDDLGKSEVFMFHVVMVAGLLTALGLPIMILICKKNT